MEVGWVVSWVEVMVVVGMVGGGLGGTAFPSLNPASSLPAPSLSHLLQRPRGGEGICGRHRRLVCGRGVCPRTDAVPDVRRHVEAVRLLRHVLGVRDSVLAPTGVRRPDRKVV